MKFILASFFLIATASAAAPPLSPGRPVPKSLSKKPAAYTRPVPSPKKTPGGPWRYNIKSKKTLVATRTREAEPTEAPEESEDESTKAIPPIITKGAAPWRFNLGVVGPIKTTTKAKPTIIAKTTKPVIISKTSQIPKPSASPLGPIKVSPPAPKSTLKTASVPVKTLPPKPSLLKPVSVPVKTLAPKPSPSRVGPILKTSKSTKKVATPSTKTLKTKKTDPAATATAVPLVIGRGFRRDFAETATVNAAEPIATASVLRRRQNKIKRQVLDATLEAETGTAYVRAAVETAIAESSLIRRRVNRRLLRRNHEAATTAAEVFATATTEAFEAPAETTKAVLYRRRVLRKINRRVEDAAFMTALAALPTGVVYRAEATTEIVEAVPQETPAPYVKRKLGFRLN